MKKLSAAILMLSIWASHNPANSRPSDRKSIVKLSETYELANIILAITDYGKTDQWEVSQHSAYYREVIGHFGKFNAHPLVSKVNYSRKLWDRYLSFRSDAYAFEFDKNGKVFRKQEFYANTGLKPFDEQLALVNDFVKISGFRKFYKQHLPYYRALAFSYLKSQHYPEMKAFLEKELGEPKDAGKYAIVMSPLVGRMNCHRTVNGVGTDFITVPEYLLNNATGAQPSLAEIASGTHMLFTELDHGFVNPLSYKFRGLIRDNFTAAKWDTGSGYEKDTLATFNEYMTWGVYDLFVKISFSDTLEKVCTDWAIQNETRGFFASALFNRELLDIYRNRKAGQTLKDLYPAIIRRMGYLQASLSRPVILQCNMAGVIRTDSTTNYVIYFSEPMEECDSFSLIKNDDRFHRKLTLTKGNNNLVWGDGGTTLTFKINLAEGVNQLLFNCAWNDATTILRSKKGVDLAPYTEVKTTVAPH